MSCASEILCTDELLSAYYCNQDSGSLDGCQKRHFDDGKRMYASAHR
jgi:hypothetical protein